MNENKYLKKIKKPVLLSEVCRGTLDQKNVVLISDIIITGQFWMSVDDDGGQRVLPGRQEEVSDS